ncbi:hypothetical protein GCM10008941_35850 [Rhizomicrobium palustre]
MGRLTQAVIPAAVRIAKQSARRAGTHFNNIQILEWVPDRAFVPNGESSVGASGMTIWGS